MARRKLQIGIKALLLLPLLIAMGLVWLNFCADVARQEAKALEVIRQHLILSRCDNLETLSGIEGCTSLTKFDLTGNCKVEDVSMILKLPLLGNLRLPKKFDDIDKSFEQSQGN